MDALTLFGFAAVPLMLLCYALEDRSPWYVFGFAIACALSGLYAVLQGAWPFGIVEGLGKAGSHLPGMAPIGDLAEGARGAGPDER